MRLLDEDPMDRFSGRTCFDGRLVRRSDLWQLYLRKLPSNARVEHHCPDNFGCSSLDGVGSVLLHPLRHDGFNEGTSRSQAGCKR